MTFTVIVLLFLAGCCLQGTLSQGVSPAIINSVYAAMGHKGANDTHKDVASWRKRFDYEGDAIVNALLEIIQKNLTNATIIQKQEDAQIVIFASVGGNGGALFDAALKLAYYYGIKNITVYYVLNYLRPNADDYDVCSSMFETMIGEGLTVENFNSTDQKLSPSVLSQAHILLDGIAGTGYRTIDPNNTKLIEQMKVSLAALAELKNVVDTYTNLLVICNDVPSGTQTDGKWDENLRYQFGVLLIPAFLKPAPTEVGLTTIYDKADFYWIFYSPSPSFFFQMRMMFNSGEIYLDAAAEGQLTKAEKLESETNFVQVSYTSGIVD